MSFYVKNDAEKLFTFLLIRIGKDHELHVVKFSISIGITFLKISYKSMIDWVAFVGDVSLTPITLLHEANTLEADVAHLHAVKRNEAHSLPPPTKH